MERTLVQNAKNEFNEPQIVIKLSDDTQLVITQVQHGFKAYDRYFTVVHKAIDSDDVIASFKYANNEQLLNGLNIYFKKLTSRGITIQED